VARRNLLAMAAFLTLMTLPAVAQAGGWAVSSFDSLPTDFEAGQPYDLTYTILQHGQTPVDVGSSVVRIINSGGTLTEFAAVPTGEVGRYAVTVTFPASGHFQWEVTQGDFATHQLGTVDVNAAAVGAATAVGANALLRWLLPAALVLVIGLIAIQALSMFRNRRGYARPVRAD
jgi:hypothetical protein